MRPLVRFVVALVLGLATLAWAASVIVGDTMRSWFHKDLAMRARLAVSSARTSLLFHWQNGDRDAVRNLLLEITRDERIVAAAACDTSGDLVATSEFPASVDCAKILRDRLPRATILAFWHIPWPNAERFGICPWRDELLAGMLGASLGVTGLQRLVIRFVGSGRLRDRLSSRGGCTRRVEAYNTSIVRSS